MTEPDWAGLKDAVERQLDATGLTPGEVAERAGMSRETIRPILNAVPGNYRTSTLAKVSLALGWTGDSARRVLDGGEPQQSEAGVLGMLEKVNAQLLDLDRRLSALERQPPVPSEPHAR